MTVEVHEGGIDLVPVEDEPGNDLSRVAARVAVGTLVVVGIVLAAVLVWEARLVVALLFSAIILAATLRPGVDWLASRGIRPGIGVVLHYAVLIALLGVALWLVVPAAVDQVQGALGDQHRLRDEAQQSTGIKHDILIALDRKLNDLPSGLTHGKKYRLTVCSSFLISAAENVAPP